MLIFEYYDEISAKADAQLAIFEKAVSLHSKGLQINLAESEIKVVNESGDSDDLIYLQEAAVKEYVDKLKNLIEELLKTIKKFFEDTKTKVINMLTDKESKETIEVIEKKIKLNPFLRNKKILVEDYEKHRKNAEEHKSMLDKLKAKFLSGRKVEVEEVNKIEESFLSKNATIMGVAAAVTAAITAVLAFIKKMGESANKVIKENFDFTKKVAEDIGKAAVEEAPDVQTGAAIARLSSLISKINMDNFTRCWKGAMTSIKSAVSGIGKTKIDIKDVPFGESFSDIMSNDYLTLEDMDDFDELETPDLDTDEDDDVIVIDDDESDVDAADVANLSADDSDDIEDALKMSESVDDYLDQLLEKFNDDDSDYDNISYEEAADDLRTNHPELYDIIQEAYGEDEFDNDYVIESFNDDMDEIDTLLNGLDD